MYISCRIPHGRFQIIHVSKSNVTSKVFSSHTKFLGSFPWVNVPKIPFDIVCEQLLYFFFKKIEILTDM